MNNCTKEIDNLYNWALENHLIRLSDDSSFGFPKDKRKILEMEALNISDSGLTEIPKEIGCLINLKEFWLNGNQISELPDEFVNLTNLEYLYLNNNPFKELPKDIDSLKNLKVLDITTTKLKRLPPNIIKLKKIESINFASIFEDNLLLCHINWMYKIKKFNDKIVVGKDILIFDLDGTLVNTDEANFFAYKEAVEEIKKIDLSSLYSKNERFTKSNLKKLMPTLSTQEYNDIIKIKNNVYTKYLKSTSINTHIFEILNKFSKTNKIILATNSDRKRADLVLKYHKLDNIFDCKFYKNDYIGENNKFKYILNLLKIDPNITIVFENDSSEVEMAKIAGIPNENIFNLKFKGEDNIE